MQLKHKRLNYVVVRLFTRVFICAFIIVSASILTSKYANAGKAQCQQYLDKLQHIQSLQRAGYSAKKGERLKRREEKARDKWWQCSRGKLKPTAKKKKKKRKNKMHYSAVDSYKPSKKERAKAKRAYATNTLVVKQRYQGEQLTRWHEFYQKPKKCQRPKTMQQFTFCIEDKNRQEAAFEQQERIVRH